MMNNAARKLLFFGTLLIAGALFLCISPAISRAATLTVTTDADSGAGSLRDAIASAASGDTIVFAGDYNIVLQSTLTIDKNLTIDGAGHAVTLNGNYAVRPIMLNFTTATLNSLTIANGHLGYNYAGGIYCWASTLNLTNCTLASNATFSAAGALYVANGSTVNVTNCTFSDNQSSMGSAIYNQDSSSTIVVTNSTFTGNNAVVFQGGTSSATITFYNSILARGNAAYNCGMNITVTGANNLADDQTCGTGFTYSTAIYRGPRGVYGGGTSTVPLVPGSAAIDAGNPAYCPATDQRGITRPQPAGGGCDIGAFESRGFTLGSPTGTPQRTVVNTGFPAPLGLSVTSPYNEPVAGGAVFFTSPESGAGATFAASFATIGADGTVNMSAIANDITGSYNVTASTVGAETDVTYSLTNADAPPGNALAFDGTNDYVSIPDADALDITTNYTIEAWIRPDQLKWLAGIVSKYTLAGPGGYTLRLSGTGSYNGINFDGMETAGGVLQPGVWQHIAAVNSNGTRHLYVNGVEIPLSGSPITPVANSGPVVIGMDYDGRYFNGAIDEVRIWNTARTPAEIRAGISTVADNSANLVAYYRFDQGVAGGDNTGVTTLYDWTANMHDGSLVNFGLTGSTSNWVDSGAKVYTVTPTVTGSGTISPTTDVYVPSGLTASFTITPDTGASVQSVSGCNGSWTGPSTYTTGTVSADCIVNATFTTAPLNGVCGTPDGQALAEAPTTDLCAAGIPTAVSGNGPWSWSCQGANGGSTASCSATNQPWSVTPSAGPGGTITPDTAQSLFSWATASFTITPGPGYRIDSVTGCNGSLTGTTYTTGPVTADCTVAAQFQFIGTMTVPGNALAFDGTDDFVSIPDADSLDIMMNYTIEAWIKPNEFKWLGGIVSKYTNSWPGDWNGYTLRMGMNGNFSGINFDGRETAEGVLQLGVWQHIAAVNDNGTRHVYINGVEMPLSGSAISRVPNTSPVVIGMDFDGRYFNGAIDEVRIWNIVRTPAEIQSGMSTVPENSPGLVAYYRLDQGTAGGDNAGITTLYDRTANKLDGSLVNFSLTGTTSNWIASGAAIWRALTLSITGPGSVHGTSTLGQNYACTSPGCAPVSFVAGDQVDLTATGSNSTFGSWTGDCTGSGNPCHLVLDSDKSVTATFTPDPASVRIDGDPASYYEIGAALAVPAGPATVRIRSVPDFIETITMTNPVTILLKGGYDDADFSSQTGYSTISGSLKIRSGTVRVERLRIKP